MPKSISKKRSPTESSAEPLSEKKKRATRILNGLEKLYPTPECALIHDSAFELLIATILSAQCTDERVNMVTPALFKRFRNPRDFAAADQAEIEKYIQSTGFFRNKAKNIKGAATLIEQEFNGEVPDNMSALLKLPGVARKTANVILGTWFGKNEGFVVDTHIGRLAHRFDLTWRSRDSKDAVKIEQDLMEVFPQDRWTDVGHMFILHGRAVCSARKPDCANCTVAKHCPSAFTFDDKKQEKTTKKKSARKAKT